MPTATLDVPARQSRITDNVRDMLEIIESPDATEQEKSAAASTIVEAIAPDIMEQAVRRQVEQSSFECMITVRMSLAMRVRIRNAAHASRQSMNTFCMEAIVGNVVAIEANPPAAESAG